MVTTRRQSKTIEPPALPPVAPPKRKRSDDTTAASSAAQLPKSLTKRRKKVKSTAKVDTTSVSTETAPAAPPAKNGEKPSSVKATERKARRQKAEAKAAVRSRINGKILASSQKSAHVDLTNDDSSSEDEAPRQHQSAASHDADDEDADSRYALGSKRKGIPRRPAPPTAPRTAELEFEENGLEEVDKAAAAVADTNNRISTQKKKPEPTPWNPINATNAGGNKKETIPQLNGRGKSKAKPRKVPAAGVPSKVVMFTTVEAIATLSLYKDGTMSMAAEIDPESRQPYKPLQTGEYLSYPVKGSYHLGALGRYGIDTISPPPFSLTVPLSEHSFIESTNSSTAEPSRHGLGFSAFPARPKVPSVRRANNYCFTFGKFRGRRMDSVPISYLRSIFDGDEYHADAKLQQAFADLYPKGLYESDAESFTFEKGGFKGKRLDEVPKSYLWGLLRKKNEGGDVGGKKGRGRLERALEVWEKRQLDLTKD